MAKRKVNRGGSKKPKGRAAKKTAEPAPVAHGASSPVPVPATSPEPEAADVQPEATAQTAEPEPDVSGTRSSPKPDAAGPPQPPSVPGKMKKVAKQKSGGSAFEEPEYESVTDESDVEDADVENAQYKWATITLIRHAQVRRARGPCTAVASLAR